MLRLVKHSREIPAVLLNENLSGQAELRPMSSRYVANFRRPPIFLFLFITCRLLAADTDWMSSACTRRVKCMGAPKKDLIELSTAFRAPF
jgi:hypothetical protein